MNLSMSGRVRIGQTLGRSPARRQGPAWPCHQIAIASERGFTLLEIILVIAVIAIVSIIALPAFNTMHEHGAVNSATNSLLSHLKQARVIALAENRSVSITFTANSYTYDADTSGTCGLCKPDTVTFSSLSKNLAITPTTTRTFTSRGTANSGTITLAAGSYSHSIALNIIGRAYEQ
jgi:type IV fimbrial biogenesis protein FimT